MIDYKEIIDNLKTEDIIKLLQSLGAEEYIQNNDYVIFPTICHNMDGADASMKLYYYENSHMFMCYTECGAMSIFQFLKHYYETRLIEYDWYNDILKVVIDCSNAKLPSQDGFRVNSYKSNRDRYYNRKNRKELPSYSDELLNIFQKYYPVEWEKDRISHEAMDKFNIRFSTTQNKIIIPHYDINNQLIGIRGRALNEDEIELVGKYMPVQIENKWYNHPLSMNLYGLNHTYKNIINCGICYLYESEKAVLQAESYSFPNCGAAICGSNLNKFQVDILMRICHPKEIVLCLDNEELEGHNDYFNKLYNMCKKYNNYTKMSFVYDRHKITKPKDSPTDNGEEIFNKLIKERVRVI